MSIHVPCRGRIVCRGPVAGRGGGAQTDRRVAVASYNDLISDINFVGGLVDKPQLGAGLDGLVTLVTQGKGLAGVDKARPFGAIVQASGAGRRVRLRLPADQRLQSGAGPLKLYNKVEEEDGVYKLTPKDGNKVNYVKQHDTWACFSDKAEVAGPHRRRSARRDPRHGEELHRRRTGLLGRRARRACRQVPDRAQRRDRERANNKKDDETDEQFAQRKKFLEQVEAYLVRVTGDMDQLNFRLGVGPQGGEDLCRFQRDRQARHGNGCGNGPGRRSQELLLRLPHTRRGRSLCRSQPDSCGQAKACREPDRSHSQSRDKQSRQALRKTNAKRPR